MEHRQAVEPVAHRALARLELGGPGAQQAAGQPVGQRPGHRERVERDLALERLKSLLVSDAGGGCGRGHVASPSCSRLDGSEYTVHSGSLQAASEDDIRLTPTSYIVMGFLAAMTEATPYELK